MNSINGLFNSTILDVAVGLIFVYLLFAIICTTVNEWIAGIFDIRSKNLKSAITQLLDGQQGKDPTTGQVSSDTDWFLKQFYAHPLIEGMHKGGKPGKGDPAYLPSRTFATAVMDIATPGHTGAINFQELEDGIKNGLPDGDVKKTLLAVIQNADEDINQAQKNIEDWFDDTMQRVGGWYKRRTQLWTFCIASLLTITANADTIRIVDILWTNPTVRAKIVASATNPPQPASNQPGTSNALANTSGNSGNVGTSPSNPAGNSGSTNTSNTKSPVLSQEERDELADVIGWPENREQDKAKDETKTEDQKKAEIWQLWRLWSFRILGWFLTIVAVSLGAPFWFDLLNKIVNLRNAGQKPKTGQQQAESEAQ